MINKLSEKWNETLKKVEGERYYEILTKEEVKEFIKYSRELSLQSSQIKALLRSTADEEYIKECIEKSKEIGLERRDILNLLFEKISDEEYIKECIEKSKEIGLERRDIWILLFEKISDEEYIKECIEKSKELGLESENISDLLLRISDEEYIKKCIDKSKELGFETSQIYELLFKKISDEEYIKKCIDKSKELGFETPQIYELLFKKISDEEYIKKCIEKSKEIGLERRDTLNLLFEKISDEEYIKKYIEKAKEIGFNSIEIYLLIYKISDEEYIKKCIGKSKDIGLESYEIRELLFKISDEEFIKKYIEKSKELGFDSIQICGLIITKISDEEFIKKCIEKSKELGLERRDICDLLVKKISDEEFIKKCIEKSKELGLEKRDICDLLVKKISDEEFIKKYIEKAKEIGLEIRDFLELLLRISDEEYIKELFKKLKGIGNIDEIIKLFNLANNKCRAKILIGLGIDKDKFLELIDVISDEEFKNNLKINIFKQAYKVNEEYNFNLDNYLNEVYEIFMKKNLPIIFREFEYYKNYKNYTINNFNFYDRMNLEERDKIIKQDLFEITLKSNNRELREFLENLYNGNIAFNKKNQGKELSELDEGILLKYRDVLYALFNYISNSEIKKTENVYDDIDKIGKKLNNHNKNIGENLLKKYFDLIGLDYNIEGEELISDLLKKMHYSVELAKKRNNENFYFEEGDLIKGTDFEYIEDMILNGIRSKEFWLLEKLDSDFTPLDADFSEIDKKNLKGNNFSEIIDSTYTSDYYGKTYIIIKRKDYFARESEISYTEDNDTSQKTRYIRTGIGATNIRAIITDEWCEESKYMLAQSEFYIPIIDKKTEKIIFTYEEYMKIRNKMQGLTYFGVNNYQISKNVRNVKVLNMAKKIKGKVKDKETTEEKRAKILQVVKKNIPQKEIITEISGELGKNSIEFIDTGSTGRGTNIPGDGDFDFMLKCFNRDEQKDMISVMSKFLNGRDKGGTNIFNIRYSDVYIEGLESPLEIDVTSQTKTFNIDYSSDMCVRERLRSIKRIYGEEVYNNVIDNIIVAKKILKENGIYKKSISNGGTRFGGFGGIGVENWILQSGGSFIQAMEEFIENSTNEKGEKIEFSVFKNKYPIYDFGKNHRTEVSQHDHFIEGLTEEGYEEMLKIFPNILKNFEMEQNKKDEEQEIFMQKVIDDTKKTVGNYSIGDYSRMFALLARIKSHVERKNSSLEF